MGAWKDGRWVGCLLPAIPGRFDSQARHITTSGDDLLGSMRNGELVFIPSSSILAPSVLSTSTQTGTQDCRRTW